MKRIERANPDFSMSFYLTRNGDSTYRNDSFLFNRYLNSAVDFYIPWFKLSLKSIEKVASFQNLCLPPDSAALAVCCVEDYYLDLRIISQVGNSAGGSYIGEGYMLIIKYSKRPLWRDIRFSFLACSGYLCRANLAYYFL